MIKVRINTEAPTNEPAIMSTELPIINPVKAAAIPDNELAAGGALSFSAVLFDKDLSIYE